MEDTTTRNPASETSGPPARRPRILFIKSRANDPTWKQLSHPLGVMYLAAYLRSKFGYEIKIVDTRLTKIDRDGLTAVIREFAPDIVGISALTFESKAIEWIAACAKQVNPQVPVLLGGPHATAYCDKAIETPNIDYLVLGEGELTAGRLIESLLANRDVSEIKGLVFKRGGETIKTGRAEFIEDLNQLPLPAYDLIPIKPYRNFERFSRSGSGVYMGVFSSRGCPYRCIYCHNIFGKAFRAKSAETFFAEIKYLHDTYQIREFEIFDDIFNLDRERLLKFCDLIIQSGMRVSFAFPNGVRGDLLDEEQLRKLQAAGTIYISFAIESGSPRIQKLIHKNLKLDVVRRNIEIAHSLRIHTHGFFMIGFPGETREEIQMTMDLLFSSRLHSFNIFAVMPFEGTELGNMVREMGREPVSDFSLSYLTEKFVNLTAVSDEEINRVRRQALVKFFIDPARIFYLVRDTPDKRMLYKLPYLFFRRLHWRSL